MRVLQIEHDQAVATSIELMLTSEGVNVFTTDLGEEGVELARIYDYDLITIGSGLPDMSPRETVRRIRAAGVKTAIIVCSAYSGLEEKVAALNAGADDYLARPFHQDELVARVKALVRRRNGHAQSVISTGNLSVNISTKTVSVDGGEIAFTGREYAMIELLSLRKGHTLTKENFISHIYGGMDEPEDKIIDVYICKLRAKLAKVNGHRIETVWGRGYVLRDPPKATPLDMSAEVGSFTDHPPTGYVSAKTFSDRRNEAIATGKVKRAVPVA